MFNRYWRTYPWGLQVALFLLTVFTLFSFAAYIGLALIPKLYSISYSELVNTDIAPNAAGKVVRGRLAWQTITHAGTFAIPALVFAAVTHPRLREYLGLRAPGKAYHWLLATGIAIGLMPVSLWGEAWMMKHLQFGNWATELQEQNDSMVATFLKLNTLPDLFILLATMALLPAFGEELVFRGILVRLLHRRISQRRLSEPTPPTPQEAQVLMAFPIIVTAFIFALIHRNPYGFVFIFIAACVMALVYYMTRSLLCSIWTHFLYNGLQVVWVHFSSSNAYMKEIQEGKNLPLSYPVVGLALFALSFFLLTRTQTPLPANWSDDFRGEQAEGPAGADSQQPYS